MRRPVDERLLCCNILGKLLAGQGSLASLLSNDLKERDDLNFSLLQEYCFGVCRWYHKLDAWAQRLLEKPLRKKDQDIHCLILLGLYQLFFMRTPAHATLNETVAAADTLNKSWAKGLINAVLREAQRTHESLLQQDEMDYVSKFSHPQWLLDRIKRDWPADYRQILDANNQRAPMTLRINLSLITRDSYLAQLQESGIDAVPGRLTPTAVHLNAPVDVMRLPGFAQGLVSVQDEASQLLPVILPVKQGQRVLDACAAPGGKTCALMEAVPELSVVCLDNENKRLPRLRENLARCGFSPTVLCADITLDASGIGARFDAIILDAPCSATGVIRRHPDIKLLRTADEVASLMSRQAALLDAAWPLLVSGGHLLYSTCSVLKAENTDQLTRFLSRHSDAAALPVEIPGARVCNIGSQLLPTAGENDGFYYALLRKS